MIQLENLNMSQPINRRDALLASAGLVVTTTMSSLASAQSAGLKDIDSGVSVSPEDAAEIWAVLDKYMTTYRLPLEKTLDANLDTLLFPHVRIASHQVALFPTRQSYFDVVKDPTPYIQSGWDHSIWTTRRIVGADPGKVHVATAFDRLTKDDKLIATERSLYILEKIDGRWGIRGRSSFAK
jgi:hypothetical protein